MQTDNEDATGVASEVDTKVYGDPDGLRTLGRALKQQATGFGDSAGTLKDTQGASTSRGPVRRPTPAPTTSPRERPSRRR